MNQILTSHEANLGQVASLLWVLLQPANPFLPFRQALGNALSAEGLVSSRATCGSAVLLACRVEQALGAAVGCCQLEAVADLCSLLPPGRRCSGTQGVLKHRLGGSGRLSPGQQYSSRARIDFALYQKRLMLLLVWLGLAWVDAQNPTPNSGPLRKKFMEMEDPGYSSRPDRVRDIPWPSLSLHFSVSVHCSVYLLQRREVLRHKE